MLANATETIEFVKDSCYRADIAKRLLAGETLILHIMAKRLQFLVKLEDLSKGLIHENIIVETKLES